MCSLKLLPKSVGIIFESQAGEHSTQISNKELIYVDK